MKPRLFIVLIVVIGLLAAMSSAAAAQAPSGGDRSGFPPAFAPQLTDPSVEPERPFDPEGGRPWGIRRSVRLCSLRLRPMHRGRPRPAGAEFSV